MVVPFVYTEEEYKKLEEEYANFKKKVSDDMKEIAKNQLENIGLFDKIEEENKKLKEENNELKEKIKKMEKAEERFFELMKNYVMNKKENKDLE